MSTQKQPCSPTTAPTGAFSMTSTKLRISSPFHPTSTASPSHASPSATTTEVEVVSTVLTSRLSSDAISDSQSAAQMEDTLMGLGIAAVTASRLAPYLDGLPCTPLKAPGLPTPLGGFFSQAAGTPHCHGRSRPSAGIRAMHSPLADQVPIPSSPLAARSYSPVARHGGMNSPAGIRGTLPQLRTASRSQRVNSPCVSASPYTDASYFPLISADQPASRNGMSPRCPHTRTPSSVSPSVSYPSTHRHGHEDYEYPHGDTNANDEAYASANYDPSPRTHDHSMVRFDLGEGDAFGDEADEDNHAGGVSCSCGGEYYAEVYENEHPHPYVECCQEDVQCDKEHGDACIYARGEGERRSRPRAHTMDCCTHAPLGQGYHPRIEGQRTVVFRHVAPRSPSVHSYDRPRRPIEHSSSMGRKAGTCLCAQQTQMKTIVRDEDGAEADRERCGRCGTEMGMKSQPVIDASSGMEEASGEHQTQVGRMNAGTQTDAANGNALASSAAQEGGHDVVSIDASHPSSSETSGTCVGLQTSEPVRLDVDATYSSTHTPSHSQSQIQSQAAPQTPSGHPRLSYSTLTSWMRPGTPDVPGTPKTPVTPKVPKTPRTPGGTLPTPSSSRDTIPMPMTLVSLGIGIPESEREKRRAKGFHFRKSKHKSKKHDGDDHASLPESENVDDMDTDEEENDKAEGGDEETDAAQCVEADVQEATLHPSASRTRHSIGRAFSRFLPSSNTDAGHTVHDERVEMTRKHVVRALTSIIPVETLKTMPAGQTLLKVKYTASSTIHDAMPVIKETLAMSTGVLKYAPCPGLEEAAKTLLGIWEACEHVETNKYACLRLIERCATMLFSVRVEIGCASEAAREELALPQGRLFDTIHLVQSFLHTQLHRPFVMRYLRRNEICRELDACDKALDDTLKLFGVSIQIRTLSQITAIQGNMEQITALATPTTPWTPGMITGLPISSSPILPSYVSRLSLAEGVVPSEGEDADVVERRTTTPLSLPLSSEGMTGILAALSTATVTPTPAPTPTPTPCKSRAKARVSPSTCSDADAEDLDENTTDESNPHALHSLIEIYKTRKAHDEKADNAAIRAVVANAVKGSSDEEVLKCLQVKQEGEEIPEAVEMMQSALAKTEGVVEGGDDGVSARIVTAVGAESGNGGGCGGGCVKEEMVDGGEACVRAEGDGDAALGHGDSLDKEFMKRGVDVMLRLAKGGRC